MCRFVTFLVGRGLSFSSIRIYLSALRYYQLLHHGTDPALSSFHRLHYVLRGTRRMLPNAVRPKRLPITPQILRTLHQYWSQPQPTIDATCMWAACCVGFFGFLRCGEFTCQSWAEYKTSMLSVQDVSVDNHANPQVVHLRLRQSKTDVFGVGVVIHLGRTNDLLCPVSSLLAYLAIRTARPGPLLLLANGNPLSREVLVSHIRRALAASGFDVSGFTGHSFRIGAATTAGLAGFPDSTIQMLGRWKSDAFTRYLRSPGIYIASLSRHLTH